MTVTEAGNKLQEPEQENMASSQQLSFPGAPWLCPGQTANFPQPDLQHDRKGLVASQEKALLLVFHGLQQLFKYSADLQRLHKQYFKQYYFWLFKF